MRNNEGDQMKNRVKSTASAVLALSLAGGVINTGSFFPAVNDGTVFAEQDDSADSSVAATGKIIRQCIEADRSLSVTNGMITLYYDSDILSVKNVAATSELSGMDISISKDVPGKIVVGFASVDPIKVSGALIYADFEYKDDTNDVPDFSYLVNEFETENEKGEIVNTGNGRIAMSSAKAHIDLLSWKSFFRKTDVNGNIVFNLDIGTETLAPVTDGECTVSYDPAVMKFDSAEHYDDDRNKLKVTETEPGTLKITFASDESVHGFLTHLYFKPLKNAVSDIVLKTDKLTGKISDNDYLTYQDIYSSSRVRFGIDISGISDDLLFDRKGTYRIETDKKISATNGMLKVEYNADNLEFKDVRLSEALNGAAVNVDVPGEIVIKFDSEDPVVLEGTIADIDFAFPSGLSWAFSSYRFSFENELENKNEDGTVIAVDPGLIDGREIDTWLDLEMLQDKTTGDIKAVVDLFNIAGYDEIVTNGSFVLSFDPEVLAFSGADPSAEQKGIFVEANEIAPGKVKCAFASEKPVTADDEILILNFKPLRSGRTKIVLDPLELVNVVSKDDIYEYYDPFGETEYLKVELPQSAVTTEPAVTTAEVASVTSAALVTTAEVAPVTSAAPVTTAEVAPVTSAAPATTAGVEPVTSAALVTTAGVTPVTSAAPVTTAEAAPVTSAAPVTTAGVEPVTSTAPVTTAAVAPVTSEAPVTTAAVAPVTSAAPVTAVTVNPVTSAVPAVTTAKVAPVTSAAPVTAVTVNPVTSVAAVTTAKVAPVTSAAPVTTVNPVTSAVPAVTTAKVAPATSVAPVTAVTVNPVTSAAPVTTAAVVPVTSAAPVTAVTVNPVTSAAPVTTAAVAPVTSAASVTTAGVEPVTSAAPVTTAGVEPVTSAAPVTTAVVEPVTSEAPVTTAGVAPVTSSVSVTTAEATPVTTIAVPPSLTPPTAEPTAPAEEESFDVNDDGAVNTKDLLSLIKMIIDPTAAKKVTADLNGDGKINAEDIIAIKKLLAQ